MRRRMALARSLVTGAALAAAAGAAASAQPVYRNVDAGGPLRPGVYGRIAFRGEPPPVIYPAPVVANQKLGPAAGQPVYWYLPPGQVRKWESTCRKYAACDVPVYFVRMDDNPGKLGQWKRRERAQRADPVRSAGTSQSDKDGAI